MKVQSIYKSTTTITTAVRMSHAIYKSTTRTIQNTQFHENNLCSDKILGLQRK